MLWPINGDDMHILIQKKYQPGELPPKGYLEWREWAEVQFKAGIKQVQCGVCGGWKTPQELSGIIRECDVANRFGCRVKLSCVVCSDCADK